MQVLGAKRKHLSGYSAATQGLHEGFIFGSEIIQVVTLQSARAHMMLTQDAMCMMMSSLLHVRPPLTALPPWRRGRRLHTGRKHHGWLGASAPCWRA